MSARGSASPGDAASSRVTDAERARRRSRRAAAIVLSLGAAFGWATYYPLVLSVGPRTAPSAVLVYPPLVGGLLYLTWALARRNGRALQLQARSPSAYVRTAIMAAMQASTLGATYLTGPVDAALLALIGDVVATPMVAAVWFLDRRRQLGSPFFALGLLLCVGGGTLAIAGGRVPEAVPPLGWIVVLVVPATIGLYFVLAARAGASAPSVAVVGFSIATSAGFLALGAPLLPGGWNGLVTVGALPLALLAFTGILNFFLAPALYFRAIEHVGLTLPPTLMTGIPVFTLFLSALFLGFELPWLGLVGVPVAVAGGILAVRADTGAPLTPPSPSTG